MHTGLEKKHYILIANSVIFQKNQKDNRYTSVECLKRFIHTKFDDCRQIFLDSRLTKLSIKNFQS